MKRPFGIYLVAFWFYFAISGLVWKPISNIILKNIFENQDIINAIGAAGSIGAIVVIIGIIQLKTLPNNIAIAMFSLLFVYQAIAIFGFLTLDEFYWQIVVYKLFLAIPSALCVAYLARNSFREYAVEFRAYKEQESYKKMIAKKMK